MPHGKIKTIVRDISWLSFNERVLQEAKDPSVPLHERIRFLGIFSNNLDEFFRIRVATLKRMTEVGKATRVHPEQNPGKILDQIQRVVIEQQYEFSRVWKGVTAELKKEKIFIRTERQLNGEQKKFVTNYFNEEVRSNIIPLMIESIQHLHNLLRDKSIYLAVVLSKNDGSIPQKYALIEIPSDSLPRFTLLPSPQDQKNVILLEDVIRFCLPNLFSYFRYDRFEAHVIKVTRDAELDIDNDLSTNIIQQLEKGLKDRKKGKPVRFIYDRQIDPNLLGYLVKRLSLSKKDNLIPGDRIHNFKDFMDFPEQVFGHKVRQRKNFIHPLLSDRQSIMEVIQQEDVLLNFPYHSFDSIIDLLREAAMDPQVTTIKITAYRLAKNSKIVNALVNAVRNGKQVTVVLELRARFDEEANISWKARLEEEGVRVFMGVPGMKVHSKICVIKKRANNKSFQLGFVSTGNLNERTARYYCDTCLLTANGSIIADINRVFAYLEDPSHDPFFLQACKTMPVCPLNMRKHFAKLIDHEIRNARNKKPAGIIIKLNSLSDIKLILKLYDAAKAGVDIKMIVRGICCADTENKKWKKNIHAVSIIDEYLEHARVFVFHNGGKEKVYVSSADWMLRNLDHRVETAVPILNKKTRKELMDMLAIQLRDNRKARILDNDQLNRYINIPGKKVRSQIEIYNYLKQLKYRKN